MKVTVGQRFGCERCSTEVIVVRAPAEELEVSCDGHALVTGRARGGDDKCSGGTLLGKRYLDEGSGLELLCTRGGAGKLAVAGTPMTIKQAKSLPSSD